MSRIQPCAPTANPSISSRLQIDAERLPSLAHNPDVFGSPTERRDVYAVRCDSHGDRDPGHMVDTPDAPKNDPVAVDEIIDLRLLRDYAPL